MWCVLQINGGSCKSKIDLFRSSHERSSISKECRREIGSKLLLKCEFQWRQFTELTLYCLFRNILKELDNEHIVRYHDRYVDKDAGILYILMEYCGGGDLSNVIKQALKANRLIPEDTIWNYFMQILLALYHCHHPDGNGRTGISGVAPGDGAGYGSGAFVPVKTKRAQILHRDLKPDNGRKLMYSSKMERSSSYSSVSG